MRLFVRYCIDFAAIYAAVVTVSAAHGLAWGVVAGAVMFIYGIFCFADGLIDR